jgi:hypothetical protein
MRQNREACAAYNRIVEAVPHFTRLRTLYIREPERLFKISKLVSLYFMCIYPG